MCSKSVHGNAEVEKTYHHNVRLVAILEFLINISHDHHIRDYIYIVHGVFPVVMELENTK